VMIDSLINFMKKAEQSTVMREENLTDNGFVLVTLHRPSNVDHAENFAKILNAFEEISQNIPIVFPIHPRAKKNLETFGLAEKAKAMKNLLLLPPLGYLDFIQLEKKCKFVITDSGGLQEETTFLGKPCLTVRENTERPITVQIGTNEIVGMDTEKLTRYAEQIMNGEWKKGEIPKYWDGKTAERIVRILDAKL